MKNIVKLQVASYIPMIATSNQNTSWFLFADPATSRPAAEIGFLRGHEEPELFMKETGVYLGMRMVNERLRKSSSDDELRWWWLKKGSVRVNAGDEAISTVVVAAAVAVAVAARETGRGETDSGRGRNSMEWWRFDDTGKTSAEMG